MTYVIGKTNTQCNMLTYNWCNTSYRPDFFITFAGTSLQLQMSTFNIEGMKHVTVQHKAGHD